MSAISSAWGTWSEAWQSDGTWQNSWTIFYWAWWVSWAPFVGVFVARISRGRTIREFLIGVMLLPASIMFFWFCAFGGTALKISLDGDPSLVEATKEMLWRRDVRAPRLTSRAPISCPASRSS